MEIQRTNDERTLSVRLTGAAMAALHLRRVIIDGRSYWLIEDLSRDQEWEE